MRQYVTRCFAYRLHPTTAAKVIYAPWWPRSGPDGTPARSNAGRAGLDSGPHKADGDIAGRCRYRCMNGDGDELGPASVPDSRPTAKGVIAVAFTVTTNRYDLLITGSSRISRPARRRLRLSAR